MCSEEKMLLTIILLAWRMDPVFVAQVVRETLYERLRSQVLLGTLVEYLRRIGRMPGVLAHLVHNTLHILLSVDPFAART